MMTARIVLFPHGLGRKNIANHATDKAIITVTEALLAPKEAAANV